MQKYSISTRFGFPVLSSKQLITYGHFQMVYSFENDVTLVSRVHIFRAPRSSFILSFRPTGKDHCLRVTVREDNREGGKYFRPWAFKTMARSR